MTSCSSPGLRVAVLLTLAAALAVVADDRAEVEAKLARESDPIDKARLQVQLAEISFQEARRLYKDADPEKGLEKLREMLSWSEQAHDKLFETGRNPRKKPKGFKDAEIKLRKLGYLLEDLRLAVPVQEREEIEKIARRLIEIREHLLLGIMRGKEAMGTEVKK